MDTGRLREDLATIRKAGRYDKPYAAEDLPILILLSVTGLVVSLTAWFFPFDRFAFLIAISPFLAILSWLSWRRKQNRESRPGLWRETRNSLVALSIVLPLVVAWMMWRQHSGILPHIAGAAGVFFVGVGCVVVGVVDRDRRTYVAGGIALLVFGLAIPVLEPKHIAIAGGMAMSGFGAIAAVMVALQIKAEKAIE